MNHPERRLRNLEARITDRRGLVPLSQAWIDYWTQVTDRILLGEIDPVERIPLAFLDWILSPEQGDA